MKTKLTLSVSEKAKSKLRHDAKQKGVSISTLIETFAMGKSNLPDKKYQSRIYLKKLLEQTPMTKGRKEEKIRKIRKEHLLKKHG